MMSKVGLFINKFNSTNYNYSTIIFLAEAASLFIKYM